MIGIFVTIKNRLDKTEIKGAVFCFTVLGQFCAKIFTHNSPAKLR